MRKNIVLLLITLCSTASMGATPSGSLSGRVELADRMVWLNAHRDFAALHGSLTLKPPPLEDGVAFLDSVPGSHTPPSLNAVFRIKESLFTPRTMPVLQGTRVVFANEDSQDHILLSRAVRNPAFKQRLKTGPTPFLFRSLAPEEFTVANSSLSGAFAWILVLQNPHFTRLDPKGSFTLRNIPPGNYQLKVWHPDYATTQTAITVVAGREISTNLIFEKGR
jgi:hypothetical protein